MLIFIQKTRHSKKMLSLCWMSGEFAMCCLSVSFGERLGLYQIYILIIIICIIKMFTEEYYYDETDLCKIIFASRTD